MKTKQEITKEAFAKYKSLRDLGVSHNIAMMAVIEFVSYCYLKKEPLQGLLGFGGYDAPRVPPSAHPKVVFVRLK